MNPNTRITRRARLARMLLAGASLVTVTSVLGPTASAAAAEPTSTYGADQHSIGIDDAVPRAGALLSEGRSSIDALAAVWGGPGSEAFQAVVDRWDVTAANYADSLQALAVAIDALDQTPTGIAPVVITDPLAKEAANFARITDEIKFLSGSVISRASELVDGQPGNAGAAAGQAMLRFQEASHVMNSQLDSINANLMYALSFPG